MPSHITIGLLLDEMGRARSKEFIVDGFPRNEENRRDWFLHSEERVFFRGVVFLACREETLWGRIKDGGRNRHDDRLEVFHKRMQTYKEETEPTIRWFKQQYPDAFLEVDG